MQLDNMSRVTVIIPNYNYSKYLLGAIDSVMRQDYPRLGVVIVDDASTDDSWDLLSKEHFSKNTTSGEEEDFFYKIKRTPLGRVVYGIRLKKNGGPSRARNFAIRETLLDTDYYVNLDADDEMYRNKVSIMQYYASMIPDIGALYADYDILDTENSTKIREFKEPFDRGRLERECIVHSGAMIKKDVLLAVQDNFGFYDEEMRTCEDYDLWMRVSEVSLIFHIPISLTLVRNQPMNSTTTVRSEVWQQNWYRVMAKMQHRAKFRNVYAN